MDPNIERFLREIGIAARLAHPHILPLFDSGETAGLLYYVTPLIDGESWRHRLDREGRLSVDEALRIAIDVGGALEYAHRERVVHRDIKPENILLALDHAIVADFGVARALAETESVTVTGVAVGTRAYMSPEQASGAVSVDEGRLAAASGDQAGAIRAYLHYLALRADPEPPLIPQADSVRREVVRLLASQSSPR